MPERGRYWRSPQYLFPRATRRHNRQGRRPGFRSPFRTGQLRGIGKATSTRVAQFPNLKNGEVGQSPEASLAEDVTGWVQTLWCGPVCKERSGENRSFIRSQVIFLSQTRSHMFSDMLHFAIHRHINK